MKLHLPIALLAAVLSAVAYGGEPYDNNNFTQEGDNKYVYSNSETGVTYSYETAADGTISSTVTGNALSTKFYNFGDWTGTVVNVPYTDSDWSASNTILNIGDSKGTATSVDTVIGAGVRGTEVLGNKTTNIHSGAEVGMAIAGYMTWNNDKYPAYEKYTSGNYNNWGASDSAQDTTISLNISGKVRDGVYGHYISSQCLNNAMNPKYDGDPSFALKEAIDIKVNGGQVDNIIVAGGFNARVDNEVSVTVNEGSQTKTIYGGVQNANNIPGYVESTHITINGGIVNGNVYGGGRYTDSYSQGHSLVKNGTLVEINGGIVTGNVFGAGNRDTVIGGTHVVVNGNADIQGHIYGGGLDGLSTVEGDRVITFDNHGEVDWTKVHDFDAVEFTGTTTTKLGTDGQLAENYKKVTIDNSYITGSIRDGHEVELDVTNNIKVALDGSLTTGKGSEIVDNKNAITIGKDATFKGTEIANSAIVAGGNIAVTDGSAVSDNSTLTAGGNITVSGDSTEIADSTVVAGGKNIAVTDGATITNSHLDAADGQVSFTDYSSMKGGEITADSLHIEGAQVEVDSINGGNAVKLSGGALLESVTWPGGYVTQNYLGQGSLKVNGDLVLAKDSDFTGHLREPNTAVLTADSISTEGAVTFTGATVEATKGDISLSAGSELKTTDLIAENGTVKLTQTTMNGGNIVAGEALKMDNTSVVVVDSINGGKAVNLQVPSGQSWNIAEGPKAASLTVNDDLVLADGSRFEGHNKIESPYIHIEGDKNVDALLTAHSIKSEGEVTFDRATVTATQGNIELSAGSSVTNTKLDANDSVQLNGTTMKGGSIVAGNQVTLNGSEVSVNSISKNDGSSAVLNSTNSKLTVTEGNLSLGSGSVVKDSALTATKGDVVLAGTTMTGSTVKTDGKFSVTENSQVTMDSLTGLNNIHISDSSLSTEKLVVNKGEIFNVTGEDRVGDNLVLTGTGKSNDEALVVDGTMNVTNATLTIEGANSQLGIGYGADGGVLNVTNSKVDVSDGTTLHIGYNKGMGKSELNIKNSEFIGGSNNAWLGGGTINVTENSTMSVCSTKDDHYNYRVLMGLSGNTVNLKVNSDSHFESNASQFVTNFNSDTNVIIEVGKGSTFTQHAKINSSAPYGVTETITYLLDSGTDANGVKYAPVNNVYTTITAVDGGSVAFNSGVTYVGSALDQAANCTKKELKLSVGEGSSMSFNDMEVYATTNVKNDGAFKAADINVHEGATFTYVGGGEMTASSLGVDKGGVMNLGSSDARGNVVLNNAGSGKSGVISGVLNVTNTNLVLTDSKAGAFWIDGGVMTVDGKSTVDLSNGGTLCVGRNDDGVLNVQGGSSLTGADNNLWVYGDSTINVTGPGSSMGVCKTEGDYNYRVLMGITNHDGAQGSAEQYLKVTDGGKFTSSATQFVTNFHSNTKTYIVADGGTFEQTGTNKNGSHYEVGTTGEWVKDKDGNWLDKGSAGVGGQYVTGNTDTITYLLSNGTDKDGVLGYPVENAQATIAAVNGGTVKFDSALTYVGNVGVSDAYIKANENNLATFTVGKDSSMSFKQMEVYAKADVKNEGTFTASKINVHSGATFNVEGFGKESGSQFILTGTGKSNDEALVVDGHMVVKNANLVMKGSSSQLGIGYNGNGTMEVIDSKVDISEGSTLHMGYNAEYTGKLVLDNSQFVGGYNNAWLGGGELVLKNGSTMDVCNVAPNGSEYNYRTILGWDGHDMKVDISGGSTMTSAATQFITNYNSNTNVEIAVDGTDSKLTHKGKTVTTKSSYALGYSGEWVEKEVITGYKDGVAETKTVLADKDTVGRVNSGEGTTKTVAYLLDSGTDEFGAKKAAVNNVTTTIKATNGGAVEFGSDKTYIGSVQDKALGYTNKHAYLSVDSTSSMSFGDMEIYADTTIDNQGKFNVKSVNVNDGATLENLGSLSLSDVALAGGELFNAGKLSITESLELEHASLLFAATALEDASSAINFTGAQLTNFGANGSGVSIDDMVDNFGIVLTGAGAQQLIDAGKTGVDFSFTLATGDATFLSQLDTVLSIEENLADFSITVNDAILREGDGELKNLQVTVEGDALVISGTAIIPEPTTATLSLLALAALAARRRRK